jgi:hypothetical protein
MKIINIIIVAAFAFVAMEFCCNIDGVEDPSNLCAVCCSAGCSSYTITGASIFQPNLTTSKVAISHVTFYKDLFVSGIYRPPRTV